MNYIYNTTDSSASNARMSMANGRLACECEQRSHESASHARMQHKNERDRGSQKGYSTSKSCRRAPTRLEGWWDIWHVTWGGKGKHVWFIGPVNMLLHASRGGEHVLYNIYIPSSIFISCFIGHVNMLLHASRGGEHFTHKREKNQNEKGHDKFNTTRNKK